MTGTIHQASGPVSGAHKCAGTRSTRAEILLPTSLGRGEKWSRLTTLAVWVVSPPATRWVSARLAPENPRAPLPPGLQTGEGGTSPDSSVAPYRGDRSRYVSPVSHCFCFLPDREVLGSQGNALPLSPRAGPWGPFFSRPAPPRVHAPKATFPMFPPWALWVPVKSADFLPVDVAGSQIQETKRHRDTETHRMAAALSSLCLPPCVSLTEHETQDQGLEIDRVRSAKPTCQSTLACGNVLSATMCSDEFRHVLCCPPARDGQGQMRCGGPPREQASARLSSSMGPLMNAASSVLPMVRPPPCSFQSLSFPLTEFFFFLLSCSRGPWGPFSIPHP